MNLQPQSEQVVASTAAPAKSPGRWRHWYRVAAYAVLNSLLLLLLANLVLYMVISARGTTQGDDPIERYGDTVLKAYPGWRVEDVKTLLRETYREATMEYEPFTGFRNRPLQKRFVHVDPAGFRFSKNQAPWPPRPEATNVFVFGGSTAWGMGLPDDETIASYLQECVSASDSSRPVAVYNFARTYYFSSQERILFQQLLVGGFVPQVAVFIDGLNDFGFPDGQPRFTDRFRRFMAGQVQAGSSPLDNVPMVKAAHWLSYRWAKPQPRKSADNPSPEVLEGVTSRWLANKKIIESIASSFGVRPIFVWQPIPTYKYDLDYHILSHGSFNPRTDPQGSTRYGLMENLWHQGRLGPNVLWLADGYALMENLRAQGKLGPNVLWLADMQQDKHENLYVDAVHYTAAFSKEIAGQICGVLGGLHDGGSRPRRPQEIRTQ